MPLLHAIILGIVQGLTEFLPISSSGHLILVPDLLGWNELANDPSLEKSFDVALHIGTLAAVVWYFRRDLGGYIVAGLTSLRARRITTVQERTAWLLLLSTIPAVIVGALFGDWIDENLGDPVLIGVMIVVFGLVLGWADRLPARRTEESYNTEDALGMGAAQVLALQPGVSRSGITITAARWRGLSREASARLSFLMSVPVIVAAAVYKVGGLFADGGIPSDLVGPFICGILAAGISGFFAIAFLLRFVQTRTFVPFVIYRVVFGTAVIIIFATGIR